MPGSPSRRAALLTALFVTVLWSSSWVIIRFGLDEEGLAPLSFAGLRYATAAAILLAAVAARPAARARLRADTRRELPALALLGLVFYTLTQGGQFVALDHQPAATTSLVLSLSPLLAVLVSGRALGERPTRRQVAGAGAVAVGAGLYFSGALGATFVGMVAALVTLLANVAAALLGRRIHRVETSDPLVTTALSMAVGSLVLLAVGLAVEGWPRLTGRGALLVLWLALVNTALAFTLWNRSAKRLTATESVAINNTMLVQIALLAWLFLGEAPSPRQIAGIALVSLGVAATQRLFDGPAPSGRGP